MQRASSDPGVTCAWCLALMHAVGLQILFTDAWNNVIDVEPKLCCLSFILVDAKRVEHRGTTRTLLKQDQQEAAFSCCNSYADI